MKEKYKCPICNGNGIILGRKFKLSELRKRACNILYLRGYGIREIQRVIGYKSPNSVSVNLDLESIESEEETI